MSIDRTRFVGGSDIGAILGLSPYRSIVDVWLDKIAPAANDDGKNAVAKRRGSRLEPYLLDLIREEHGLEVLTRNERYVDPQVPYFAAEIDAETADENVELKTVHPFKAKEWGTLESDELPLHYLAQVQWGLGIRKRPRCRVFALIGDDLRPYVVERDDETIAALRERAAEFWTKHVVPKERPPLDYDDPRTIETLRRLYPGTDGTTVEATAEHASWRAVFEQAKEKAARYEAVADGAKAHLLETMGSAALLRFDDGKGYRRKEVATKAYTIERLASKHIDFRAINLKE